MKTKIKKWAIRIATTGILLVGFLIGLVLSPSLFYAYKTEIGNYIIFHNTDLNSELETRLFKITDLVKESELYNPKLRLEICLNDGASYPKFIEKLRGPGFGWGFYNIIVLQGIADFEENTVELNGYKWNLEQLIAHETIHCYQFDKFGIWNSKPFKNYPNWKWEGYPEYISRQKNDQIDLYKNIDRLFKFKENTPDKWAIEFSDGTISPIDYFEDWLLVKYYIEVEQLSYEELLEDKREKKVIKEVIQNWYNTR